MSSVRDNVFVNYDVTTVEVNTSSDVTSDNFNCDVSGVQISNISLCYLQSDREVERAVKTIRACLRKMMTHTLH